MQALIPWQRVRVQGSSMVPTLLPGDWLLVRHGAPVRPGVIVLARFRSRPELPVLKRTVAEQDGGWLLASDNPSQGSDSRTYGVADVEARVVRIWRRAAGTGGGRPKAALRRWLGARPGVVPESGNSGDPPM
jgi:signal peptidase I